MSDYQGIINETPGLIRKVEGLRPDTPTTPQSRPSVKRVNLRCDTLQVKVPDVLEREYQVAFGWLSESRLGAMANVMKNLSPNSTKGVAFSNFDFRWIGHWTFALKLLGRIFKFRYTVEWAAEVYVGLWESSGFNIVDKALLERTIMAGVIMADTLWFADNLHIPIVAKAYKLNLEFLALHKARVTRDTQANNSGKPWWWRMHPMYHPTAEWLVWLWGDWLLTGDKESLAGYSYISAQVKRGFAYAKTQDGTEIVLIPHFVKERNNDQWAEIRDPLDAQDATYCETFIEAAITLYWAGADVFDGRFITAYANTMMLTLTPEGFGAAEMAEAICGSTPKGQPARNNEQSAFLVGGEVLTVHNVRSNRTGTRQHAICLKRASTYFGTPWATRTNPKLAPRYHANLDELQRSDTRLGAASLAKVASVAQTVGYRVTEAY